LFDHPIAGIIPVFGKSLCDGDYIFPERNAVFSFCGLCWQAAKLPHFGRESDAMWMEFSFSRSVLGAGRSRAERRAGFSIIKWKQ
jgi:hypothetical protein